MCKLIKEVYRIKKQKKDYTIKMNGIIATQKELENKLRILENIKKELQELAK